MSAGEVVHILHLKDGLMKSLLSALTCNRTESFHWNRHTTPASRISYEMLLPANIPNNTRVSLSILATTIVVSINTLLSRLVHRCHSESFIHISRRDTLSNGPCTACRPRLASKKILQNVQPHAQSRLCRTNLQHTTVKTAELSYRIVERNSLRSAQAPTWTCHYPSWGKPDA